MLTNLSINYVLSIKAKILAKTPCIENTGIFGFAPHSVHRALHRVHSIHSIQDKILLIYVKIIIPMVTTLLQTH